MQMQCLAFCRENAALPKMKVADACHEQSKQRLNQDHLFFPSHQKLAAAFGLGAVGLAYRSE